MFSFYLRLKVEILFLFLLQWNKMRSCIVLWTVVVQMRLKTLFISSQPVFSIEKIRTMNFNLNTDAIQLGMATFVFISIDSWVQNLAIIICNDKKSKCATKKRFHGNFLMNVRRCQMYYVHVPWIIARHRSFRANYFNNDNLHSKQKYKI